MKRTHLIGNAHLDPVWLWRGREGFSEILATFHSALDRMREFPGFAFTSACAAYYEWLEAVDPDLFEEIRQRVREGRWSIVGGWYLQPDCNVPGGEWLASGGLGYASDVTCGYDTAGGDVRPTLFRSAIYADHYGHRDAYCAYMERGTSQFRCLLFPFTTPADAKRRADELNSGLRAVR